MSNSSLEYVLTEFRDRLKVLHCAIGAPLSLETFGLLSECLLLEDLNLGQYASFDSTLPLETVTSEDAFILISKLKLLEKLRLVQVKPKLDRGELRSTLPCLETVEIVE